MRYAIILFSLFMLLSSRQEVKAQGKKIVVKGTVLDRVAKKPIPGVSVMAGQPLKTIGQTSDDGRFVVSVEPNTELTFKYISFKAVKRKVGATDATIDIQMVEEVNALKETVVIGYTKKTKEVSTGSSMIITAKEIQDAPEANVMALLQGRVAGLNIQNNNGTPGYRGSVNIRGVANVNVSGTGDNAFLTPTSPLYVVDGIPVDDNTDYSYGFEQAGPGLSPISLIPVEDIQQIEILKDAQATSLYGSRGAYGVILITTKRGNSRIPIIKYTTNFTVRTPPSLRAIIGGRDERMMRINQIMTMDTNYYHAIAQIGNTPFLSDSLNAYYNNSTNWQDRFYRTTMNQTHNIDISGGENKFNYKVNVGYFGDKGIVENTDFNRYSITSNAQYQPNDRFRLFAAVTTVMSKNSTGAGNGFRQTGVASSGQSSSLLPPPSLFTATNDLLGTLNIQDENRTINITTNLDIEYEILKGLRASNTFSFRYNSGTKDTFKPGSLNFNENSLYNYYDRENILYNRSRLGYVKVFAKRHTITAAVFTELNASDLKANAVLQNGTPNDQIKNGMGYDWLKSRGGTLDNLRELRSASLGTSFSYNYDLKYVLDLSYRWDGSSTNGPESGWAKSPSVGLRWNFNRENFMSSLTWLDYSSIRVSYGKNIVPTGTIYDVYGRYVAGGNYNQNETVNLDLNVIPNTGLTPTTTTQYNAGFEAGILNGKLGVIFDTYYKQTDNQLRTKSIANHNAFTNVSTNETSVVNYGYELTLNTRPLSVESKLNWTLGVNFAINKGVMAALPDGVNQLLFDDTTNGQSILYRLGKNPLSNVLFHNKGVYATDAEVPVDPSTGLRYRIAGPNGTFTYFKAGDPIWTDLNGDYILDQNDYVNVGDPVPAITGGINSSMQYGKWSLQLNATFTLDRDILNNALASQLGNFANPTSLSGYVPIEQFNYWKQPGDNATYPNPYDYTRYAQVLPFRYNQTLFMEDGSYLKISQATLSYNLDRNWTKKWGVSSARIYGTAYNIYTFSNYSGPNPESVNDLGRDTSGGYPNARSYTLGLNVQF
jgi:TonB-linked SusC/RagA family outer membrane protein